MSLGARSRVQIGRKYYGDFGAQINYARRLPPGPPIQEDRKDVWAALLIYLIARKR